MKMKRIAEIETIVVDKSSDITWALLLVGIVGVAGKDGSYGHEKKYGRNRGSNKTTIRLAIVEDRKQPMLI